MSGRQRALLEMLYAAQAAGGVMPSYAELAERMGLASKSGIHRLVSALADKGLVRVTPGCWRGLKVLWTPPTPGLTAAEMQWCAANAAAVRAMMRGAA